MHDDIFKVLDHHKRAIWIFLLIFSKPVGLDSLFGIKLNSKWRNEKLSQENDQHHRHYSLISPKIIQARYNRKTYRSDIYQYTQARDCWAWLSAPCEAETI